MVTKKPEGPGRQIPIVTLLVVAGAIGTYATPGLASRLIYDRTAILAGEVWRLLTGNWVHFSARHLLYDLLALGIAGWIIERRGYPYFGLLCLLSALDISTVLLLVSPDVQFYGGLSGIATGAIIYLALHGLEEPGPWRWLCLAALVLIASKMLLEALTGWSVLAAPGVVPFVPLPLTHLVGGLTACILFLWNRVRNPGRGEKTHPV